MEAILVHLAAEMRRVHEDLLARPALQVGHEEHGALGVLVEGEAHVLANLGELGVARPPADRALSEET